MKALSILVWVLVLIACEVAAQTAPGCNAPPRWCDEGWMQGFPPPPNKQVTRTGSSTWLRYPNNRWGYQHTRELVPAKIVSRGGKPVVKLQEDLQANLDVLPFLDETGQPTNFDCFIKKTYTDAIIVLHKGKIVYERYENCMDPETYHLLFSVSKSFVGLVAAIMAWNKKVNENSRVGDEVPQLRHSAYSDATLRQVMDMLAGVKFLEDYTAQPCSNPRCIRCYAAAASWWMPGSTECQGQSNLYEALLNLTVHDGSHGGPFAYKSPNADVLAWVVSKRSKKSLAELVSELIWSKIGAEHDAYYLVDAVGKEAAFAGLNVTLRDFARFGQMMLQKGRWNGRQVVPRGVIQDIMKGGNFLCYPSTGETTLQKWSYRSLWWIMNNANGAYMARGNNGQRLYIDPTAQLVVAKFASEPYASPPLTDTLHQNAFDALAAELNKP